MPHSKDRSDLVAYLHINKNETDIKRNIVQDRTDFPVPAFRSEHRYISTSLILTQICTETLTKQPDFLSTLRCLVNVMAAIWHVVGGREGEQIYALIGRGWERAVNSTLWSFLPRYRDLVPFAQLAGWAQDGCGEETILLPQLLQSGWKSTLI
jgi:hypothetical protein